MRTSRIPSVTSSIFRNSKQYLQTNERVFQLLNESEENKQKSRQNHEKEQEREKAPKNQSIQRKVIRKNGKEIIVKGIQSDAYSMVEVHNRLLQKTISLNNVYKKAQIGTYRSSI